jgi:hypothetical protein
MQGKPTIKELEEILEKEEDTPIEILPNGEIRPVGGSASTDLGGRKPVTMREDLGGEYGVGAWI